MTDTVTDTLGAIETPEEARRKLFEASSWAPQDLGPYVRGEVEPVIPSVGVPRVDGLRLLYPGKEHIVYGFKQSGKSWFCLMCVQDEIKANRSVVYVHFEEVDPQETVERLMALGVSGDDIVKHVDFIGPEHPLKPGYADYLAERKPGLVILDGINEALSLNGWEGHIDGPSNLKRLLVNPFLKVGAAVLECDHLALDQQGKKSPNPYGGVHKGNKVNGSMILLENKETFGRGLRGRSSVYVTKDRPGHLYSHGKPTKVPGVFYMGELVIDHVGDQYTPSVTAEFYGLPVETFDTSDSEQWQQDDQLVSNVMRSLISREVECNVRSVHSEVHGISKDRINDALQRLVNRGVFIEHKGPRNARIFTEPGTVAEDQPG